MSEDRNNGISDPAVSDTYRDVATERAPASLNEAVLRNAAAHASKGYAHSMLWLRPLAYAATVVLSLAIVVQVVLPPNMDADIPAASVPASMEADAFAADASLAATDAGAREQTAEDDPLKRLRDQEVREESKIEEFELPAVAVEAGASVGEVEDRQDSPAPAEVEEIVAQAYTLTAPASETLEAAVRRNRATIEQASELNSSRQVQPGVYADALGTSVEGSVCEAADLESPETWAGCIERLEDAGRTEEALAERTLLTEAFPGFEWPAE